jgi:hypothetical protein
MIRKKKDDNLRLRADDDFFHELDAYVDRLRQSGKDANRSTVVREAVLWFIRQNPPELTLPRVPKFNS